MTRTPRRIGIIGAGQLGRMLALAGYPLGLRFRFLDHSADAPGGQIGEIITGDFADPSRLTELARGVDLMTFDVENVPSDALRAVTRHAPVLPPVVALETAQDRLSEKAMFQALDIPAPVSAPVETIDDLRDAVSHLGLPAVLKTRRLGYDGRGQAELRSNADLAPAFDKLGGVPLILEQFVVFDREVSIIGVRSTSGETAFYPLAENVHVDGILRYTLAPLSTERLQQLAEEYCRRIFAEFDYAGALTIEFFEQGDRLLANEIAPRVHNSGHWTIEGARTSQFENHIRAILGLPLGATTARGHSALVNFLGELPPLTEVLAIPGAHYHDYGKTPRPLRKLGHCTIIGETVEERDAALTQFGIALPRHSESIRITG